MKVRMTDNPKDRPGESDVKLFPSAVPPGTALPVSSSVGAGPQVSGGELPAAGIDSAKSLRKNLDMNKPFRFGEAVIEKSIQGVAFISLLFILLIFVFIFKEAFPLFTGHMKSAPAQADVGASETYGEDPGAPMAAETPELEQKQVQFESKHLLVEQWQPVSLEPKYGLLPLLLGSLKVTLVAL